ncbi:MAG: alpha/beta fold hydrolase [Solirubrobacteraceae bacterium]
MTTTTSPAPTTQTGTRFATSADGTRIAYEAHGTGPAVVFVDGALCQRAMGPAAGLAKALAGDFTVHVYDRRHRGESDPGATPWSVEREIEDLAAVVDAAGGSAHVFAASSGAALSLDAARAGVPIDRLALYEAPFILDDTHAPAGRDVPQQLQDLVARGRRGEAVKTFMRSVGVPAPFVGLMRLLPAWKTMTAAAHTLPYDLSIVVPHQQGEPLPEGRYAGVGPETLVIAGGKSPEHMRNAQARIAEAVPHARLETLPGQTHMIKPKATVPVLRRFFLGGEGR